MKKINFFIILYFSINLVFSQHNNFSNKSSSEKNSYNWIVDYPDNIRLPFTSLEIQKLKYIYGDQLKKYVLDKPSRVKDIKHIFRNRIFIGKKSLTPQVKYPLLSSVKLFNIYNKNLSRPHFDKETFNPFIYNFNFGSKSELIYRVDNSDYIIIIKSKFRR
jgi:hypothetical protein